MKRLYAALALISASCTGETGVEGADGDTALIRAEAEAPGDRCKQGGTRLSIGLDTNRDAVLSDDEVLQIRYVCNGEGVAALHSITDGAESCPAGGHTIHWGLDIDGDGALGEQERMGSFAVCNGPEGDPGPAGSIQILEPIDLGDTCPAGGFRLSFGRDTNGNGVLDPQEIEGSAALCNGEEGLTSLIEQVKVKAGDECANGGVLIRSGIDRDGSGMLEPDEVEAETVLCEPCPHPGSSNCTTGTMIIVDPIVFPSTTFSLAVGDVDGNGHQDILANDSRGNVHVSPGRGDGTFGPPTQAAASIGGISRRPMVLADFDGDGHLDLVNGHPNGADLLPGIGDGSFGTPVPIDLDGQAPRSFEVTSIGDDALPDLLVSTDDAVTLLHSVGDGTFVSVRTFVTSTQNGPPAVTTGDLDGDGYLDLIFPVNGVNEPVAIGIALNQGDGTFSEVTPIELFEDLTSVLITRLGDVDGDGHLDLVFFGRHGLATNSLHLALGDGQGGFTPADDRHVITPGGLELADFDGDGYLDIALVHGAARMLILPTDGISIGDAIVEEQVGLHDLALGDFNEDGKVDIAVSGHHAGRVSVLLGD